MRCEIARLAGMAAASATLTMTMGGVAVPKGSGITHAPPGRMAERICHPDLPKCPEVPSDHSSSDEPASTPVIPLPTALGTAA